MNAIRRWWNKPVQRSISTMEFGYHLMMTALTFIILTMSGVIVLYFVQANDPNQIVEACSVGWDCENAVSTGTGDKDRMTMKAWNEQQTYRFEHQKRDTR